MKEYRGGDDLDDLEPIADPNDETRYYRLEVMNEVGEDLEDD